MVWVDTSYLGTYPLGKYRISITSRALNGIYSTYYYIGILENKMETTIMGYVGYILGLYWGNNYWDNGE